MKRSPETYDEWMRESKILNAIAQLKHTKTLYAFACCRFVKNGWGDLSDIKKCARLALAADQGDKKATLKYLKGEF